MGSDLSCSIRCRFLASPVVVVRLRSIRPRSAGNAPENVSAIRPAMRLSGTRTADTPIPVPDLAEDAGLFGLQHSLQASPVLGLLFQLIRVRAFLSIFLQLLNLLQATFNLRSE